MTRLRLTIAEMMLVVFAVAGGFAALRNASRVWATATYDLAVLMLAVSTLLAIVRKGRNRNAWAGFAVFGWTYAIMQGLPPWASGGMGFGPIPRPTLPIESATALLQPYLRPMLPAIGGTEGELPFRYEQISLSLGIILFGLLGALVGRFLAAEREASR